jgi:Ricin-type beta-trefoil lectin domain-like
MDVIALNVQSMCNRGAVPHQAGNTSPRSTPLTVTTSPDPAAWYQVINTNSGKCLDGTDWGTGNGTALQQWTCSTQAANNQLWQFQPTDNGYYRVANRHTPSKGWDVTGGPQATGNGARLQLWDYVGGTNQQWKPTPPTAHTPSPPETARNAWTSPTSRNPTAHACSNGPAPAAPRNHSGSFRPSTRSSPRHGPPLPQLELRARRTPIIQCVS